MGPADFLINWVLPAIAVVLFWVYRQATPGKIAIGARIVDAETGDVPSTGQLVGRYLGYYVSIIPLMLGIIWVARWKRRRVTYAAINGSSPPIAKMALGGLIAPRFVPAQVNSQE